jgi:hypothetical protein
MLSPVPKVSPPALRTDKMHRKLVRLISREAARTEPLTPACCATPSLSPQAKPIRTAT